MKAYLGQDLPRSDAHAKVTGQARYTAELTVPGLVYATLVGSTVASGRILSVQFPPGPVGSLCHLNAPVLGQSALFDPGHPKMGAAANREAPFQSDRVNYYGQPVACVVAASLEEAQHAAACVQVTYKVEPDHPSNERSPKDVWGKPAVQEHGQAQAPAVTVDEIYTTPVHHHNAMEPHATIAHWDGDSLFVYDSCRFVAGERRMLAEMFDITSVHVVAPLIGGAFGGKGAVRENVPIAAMAARLVGRPVKLVLTRRQVTELGGHRPLTRQRVKLEAESNGQLTSIVHEGSSECSATDDYVEPFSLQTFHLYAAPHRRCAQTLVARNVSQPTTMRAPGEAAGMFALESAMDELAAKLGVDPIELRLRNEPLNEPVTGKTFSMRLLRECLERGAEEFGWERRRPAMRDGDYQIGLGVACAVYPFKGSPTHARCRIANGRVLVQSSTHEFGNGITTVMRQIAADTLGVELSTVDVEIGDTDLPEAPISGGSTGTMWVGEAVRKACLAARATGDSGVVEAAPDPELQKHYSLDSYGAHFSEVAVHLRTREVRVRRHLGVFNVGRILSPRQARSQFYGAITMGIGMALLEENPMDHQGKFANPDLDGYLVPVQADIPALEVIWLDQPDPVVNPLGVRGAGEIGIVGAAAAVANAVFHATGVRVRDLPIRADRLL